MREYSQVKGQDIAKRYKKVRRGEAITNHEIGLVAQVVRALH
jgi:hypothetical protein